MLRCGSFQVIDGNGLVKLTTIAVFLTGMGAYIAANSRKRIYLFYQVHRLFELALRDQGYVSCDIRPRRTVQLARSDLFDPLHTALEPGNLGDQRQESAQRAEITAPTTPGKEVQGKDDDKRKDQDEPTGGGNGNQLPYTPCPAQKDGQRIKEVQREDAENGNDENEGEDEILDLANPEGNVFSATVPVEIKDSPQGADPPAPDPPQSQGDEQEDEGGDKDHNKLP